MTTNEPKTEARPSNVGTAKGSDSPTRPFPTWAAYAFVFCASGAVMTLEVLALRLIAPYIGITLETSAAVIGAALAAIAFGAWAGGKAADVRDPRRLLGAVLLLSGVVTLLVLPAVRWTGVLMQGGNRVAIIVMASIAIVVPAALLSTISPLIIKLQLQDLKSTGTTVGRLYGVSTLGGILATFLTGFVAVALLPSSVIVLTLGAILLVSGLVTTIVFGTRRVRTSIAALVVGFCGMGLTFNAPSACDIETAYQCARVIPDPERPATGRILKLGNSEHSYTDIADPMYLAFPHVQVMVSAFDLLDSPAVPRILHIGGGGMTLPRYLAAAKPQSENVVYEIDRGVVELARQRLDLRESDKLRVHVEDGRVGLQQELSDHYDMVVGDAFGHHSPPWHLTTHELLSEVRRVLHEDGVYVGNLIDFPPMSFAMAEVATVRSVFPHVALVTTTEALERREGGNFLIVAASWPIPADELRARIRAWNSPWELIIVDETTTAKFAEGGFVLRDDYAPVDQLVNVPFQYW